ncbi:unnamed protein product [Bursaphelenchus xylophilus]|uniref:Glutathione synthetase n=1 Tax=Bursaphelenchus xylophilus TaxID=6326 RepID=A0A1I7SWU7_BURXY|nr:unnamed protein product [Bursaphelenchus xylophilus]CAG9099941.1 unnamed protein product [Bursaphelenchus xylophilus]
MLSFYKILARHKHLSPVSLLRNSSLSDQRSMSFDKAVKFVPDLLEPAKLDWLVEEASDFAHCVGLVLRTREHKHRSDVCQAAPLALLPSPFPRHLFEKAVEVQKWMNLLYFRISFDEKFLLKAHERVIETDEFTSNMVKCFLETIKDGLVQKKVVLTQRADYMCHHIDGQEPELKQIEVNNIAVSMGGLSQRASLWHRRALVKLGVPEDEAKRRVPDNQPIKTLAAGLATGWKSYGNPAASVLVVIEEVNQNQLDMRFVEYEIEESIGVHVNFIRATLTQCYEKLTTKNRILYYEGQEIGLVYFRAGYSPSSYPTNNEWEARTRIEKSLAIKCPWIGLQLANTKKVQQVLDKAGVVENYLSDQPQEVIDLVRSTFAGLWGLETNDQVTLDVIKDAKEHPERYVLKPQLEGGGGNYYGDEIREKLNQYSDDERSAHILMQRIQPLIVKNYHLRAFEDVQLADTVSELGIYGCLVGETKTNPLEGYSLDNFIVKSNTTGGQILRSKAEDINEGGVAVGAAVIDTPYLF